MKVAIYTSGEKERENLLVDAVRASGVGVVALRDVDTEVDVDLHCLIGVKCRSIMQALTAAALPYLYLDKGYNRDWPAWWRISYCSQQPVEYLHSLLSPMDRATTQGWPNRFAPWRVKGTHVLYAGSSAKYSHWLNSEDPTTIAKDTIAAIQNVTARPIIYRPKPSWRGAEPVMGAGYSWRGQGGPDIHRDLVGAHVLVTYGSSCCFDALMAGVPSIVLGNGVLAGISSRRIDEIEQPRLASADERIQLLADLAYCQWSLSEFKRGEPWDHIRSLMQKSI